MEILVMHREGRRISCIPAFPWPNYGSSLNPVLFNQSFSRFPKESFLCKSGVKWEKSVNRCIFDTAPQEQFMHITLAYSGCAYHNLATTTILCCITKGPSHYQQNVDLNNKRVIFPKGVKTWY